MNAIVQTHWNLEHATVISADVIRDLRRAGYKIVKAAPKGKPK